MLELVNRFWTDESGQALTEYALIIALVSIGLILVLIAFRDELGRIFNALSKKQYWSFGIFLKIQLVWKFDKDRNKCCRVH